MILRIFYAERDADTNDYHLRQNVRLAIDGMNEGGGGPGGGGGAMMETVNVSADASVMSTRQIAELPINGRSFKAEYGRNVGGDR